MRTARDDQRLDAQPGSIWRQKISVVFVAGCLGGLAISGSTVAAAETNPDTSAAWRTNFAAYLTNRPWVAEVEMDLSKNRYRPDVRPASNYVGFTTWRASLQPAGFFAQIISNSPYSFATDLIYGESIDNFWQGAQGSIAFISKDPDQGWTNNSPVQTIALVNKREIINVLNLGIKGLANETAVWASPDELTADLLDWTGDFIKGKVRIKIEKFEKGLPVRLRYWTTAATNEEVEITCRYAQPFLPPTETVIQKWRGGKEIVPWTNVIQRAVFGIREDAARGFTPSSLLMRDFVPKRILIESNRLAYVVHPDGGFELWDKRPEDLGLGRHNSAFIPLLCVSTATIAVLIVLVRKIGPRAKGNHKGPETNQKG